jgi:hypothetical protein
MHARTGGPAGKSVEFSRMFCKRLFAIGKSIYTSAAELRLLIESGLPTSAAHCGDVASR